MDDSEGILSIKEKINVVLTDRAEVNNIIDIIERLDDSESSVVVACINGLNKIFTNFVKSGECSLNTKGKTSMIKKGRNATQPEEVFHTWIKRNYNVTIKKLLKLIHCSDLDIQEECLTTLMAFLKAECEKLNENSSGYIFPNGFFLKLLTHMTDGSSDMENLIRSFKHYLQFTDICYYVLRNLSKISSKFLDEELPRKKDQIFFSRNIFYLLRQVTLPEDMGCLFCIPDDNAGKQSGSTINHSMTNLASHKKVFTGAWMTFLGLSLDADIHRHVLVSLHEKVMPYLLDPKVLMDFLVDSYNIGGLTSILSLNGLFVLVRQYNLHYPEFYKKLYSLFGVEIFHLKYKGRFFYLADLFLSSTHLPAYLVAAFIKRLSRLALRAPPYGIQLIVMLIGNLIRRHPNCKTLIHQKGKNMADKELEGADTHSDPFIEDETDPEKCQALQSSLWELETLRRHFYPGMKDLVELFEKPLSKDETDISVHFDASYDSLFSDECIELTKTNAFIEYHIPKGLFSDSMNELWCEN